MMRYTMALRNLIKTESGRIASDAGRKLSDHYRIRFEARYASDPHCHA